MKLYFSTFYHTLDAQIFLIKLVIQHIERVFKLFKSRKRETYFFKIIHFLILAISECKNLNYIYDNIKNVTFFRNDLKN